MKLLLRTICIVCIQCYAIGTFAMSTPAPDQILWFQYPATDWATQALHLGNGYMGASFYGGVEKERFDIAEKIFWAGGPHVIPNYHFGNIAGGKDKIELIREKIVTHDCQTSA